jgi:hypothetical protein
MTLLSQGKVPHATRALWPDEGRDVKAA